MQELEKILEEINEIEDEYTNEDHNIMFKLGAAGIAGDIKDIISKHMNEKNMCAECSRRKWYQIGYKDGKYDDWIPVEERLPEDGTYLCTLDGELCGIKEPFTGMCGIENGIWDEPDCVIAWQPLPDPYQPEREGEKKPNETQANRA